MTEHAVATGTTSPFVGSIEPVTETDDELRAILAEAELPPLLPALAYLTGDLTLLRSHLRPDPLLFSSPQGGFTPEQQAEIREIALDVLRGHRDGAIVPAESISDADVLAIMEHAVGADDMGDYLPLLEEELAHRGEDARAPRFHEAEVAPDRELAVLIIGAGMSGILAAHRLQQAGVDFTIVDKNDGVGGTWWENTYPGCRVDNPNHNYSYSIAQRHDWPYHYSTQEVLRDYFGDCAELWDVTRHVELETEVTSATWSEPDHHWSVELRRADGSTETVSADVVISAVGQLNRPRWPDIDGMDTFEGPTMHTARWDHDVELEGKRVAVVGTGASAMQVIPEIAPIVEHLDVYQRTPAWLAPTENYHDPVADGLKWLYGHVPGYSEWNRFCIFWRMGDGALEAVRVDPDWESSDGGSVSEVNDMARLLLGEYLRGQFADDPALAEACTPDYPVGAKRMIRDNGIWPRTLIRDDVELITTPIREITPTGIVTDDGEAHDVDVIVYGTGFWASRFLNPMTITGRDGVEFHKWWGGDARAHLGITVPGFPNLFCLYGPNTNIVVNGSIIYFSECGVRYILGLIELLLRDGADAVDVRKDVHDSFNEAVDAENLRMAWGVSDVNSWYKNDFGRSAQNWPFTLLEYWQRTRAPDPDEFVLSTAE